MTLLVPYDGSDLAKAVLERACEFSEYTGEDLLVLTVIPDEPEYAIARGWVAESATFDPETIADLIAGDGKLGQLVSGELDVDRMDYLVRDAHHTGVPYGTIDHSRLLAALQFRDGDLVLSLINYCVH